MSGRVNIFVGQCNAPSIWYRMLSVGSVKDDWFGSTIARMYVTWPPSVTYGWPDAYQRPLRCLAWGGVCTHHAGRVIQCTEKIPNSLSEFDFTSTLKQNPSFQVLYRSPLPVGRKGVLNDYVSFSFFNCAIHFCLTSLACVESCRFL